MNAVVRLRWRGVAPALATWSALLIGAVAPPWAGAAWAAESAATRRATASASAPALDDRGAPVGTAPPARRIVSLLPSLTETVCALGACDRLVATDRFSNHPASVRSLPKVGSLDDVQVERIVALRPDLVLVAVSSRVTDRLQSLGLRVVTLEPRSLGDTERVVRLIAGLLGSDEADAVLSRAQAAVDEASRLLDPRARGLSVYFPVGSGPYAAGAASFTGELMTRLGLVNVVGASLGPYPMLNPEFVVRADPSLIVIGQRHVETVAARPGWSRVRAVRDQRFCRLDPDAGDVLARAGPRFGEAALLISQCVNQALRDAPLGAADRAPALGSGGRP